MHRHHPTLVLITIPTGVSLSGTLPAKAFLGHDLDVYDDLDATSSRSAASMDDAIRTILREAADLAVHAGHLPPDLESCRATHVPTAPFGRPVPILCWRGSGSKLHVATPVPLPHLGEIEGSPVGFDGTGRPVFVDGSA